MPDIVFHLLSVNYFIPAKYQGTGYGIYARGKDIYLFWKYVESVMIIE